MFKKLLSFFVLTLCIVGNTWAKIPVQTWTEGKEVGYNGTFYLYNIGAERYLSRGNQHNTHAVLEGGGLEVTIEDFNNSNNTKTGKLHTNVTNGLGPYVYLDGGNGVYVDGNDALVFTFEEISGWGYTHAYLLKCTKDNTTYYLGWAGGGAGATSNEVVASTNHNQSYNFLWLLIDKNDRQYDYTTRITHPDFEGGYTSANYDEDNISGWNQKNSNHSHSTQTGFWKQTSSQNITKATFVEKWKSSAPLAEDYIYQTISNLPAGKYTLIVDAKATNLGNPSSGVYLYLGTDITNINSNNSSTTPISSEGKYQVSYELQNEGSLQLGVKINDNNDANWVLFDNVRLFKDDGEDGSYTKIGNTLTFTGAGNLSKKKYEMTDYTVVLGNEKEAGEHPNVKAIPNGKFGAYVVDRNGYEFANIQNNFPTGWGTYYTVKPIKDGRLKITVNGSNGNLPLVIVDSKGNIKKVIPGYEYVKSDVTEIDYGVVLGGETYYFFTRCQEVNGNYNWGTLYLQKTEFTPFTGDYHLVVESNDFDQYCEMLGEHIWVANTTLDCTVAVDDDNPLHGPYAYYNPGKTNNRSVYYPFEELGARQRYKLEFDALVNPGNSDPSQIALYRTKPGTNATASDYLMAIEIPKNGGSWDFKVPTGLDQNHNCTYSSVLTPSLSNNTWYHFEVEVDARYENNYKIGIKVMDDSHSDPIAETKDPSNSSVYGMINFKGSNYQALGISYLAGRQYNQAKFDNILITSNQGPIGTVTAPTIAVTGYKGQSRTVTITSGYSDEKPVKTYYQYADITTIEEQYVGGDDQTQTRTVAYNWDYILRNSTWTTWPNPFETANAKEQATTSITLSPAQNDVPKVYFVRAISTIEDYAVVRSDTAYLRVEVGKLFTPTGGFAVQEMKKISESSNYYTPVVRAYFDAAILGNDIKDVDVTIDYLPLDYGINTSTGVDVESTPDWVTIKSGKGDTFTPDATNGTRYVDIDLANYRSGVYRIHISCNSKFLPFDIQKNYYKDKYKITYQTPDFGAEGGPISPFETENSKYMNASNTTVSNRIYGYTPWDFWTMTTTPKALAGWTNAENIPTYYWNTSHSGTTATLNSVSSAQSSASTQSYDIRTIQYDTKNPIIIKKGWGIVKDSNIPWNYRCGLAHIGMGNEIPEFTIDDGMGGAHHTFKVYPTPYITGSNVPECNYSVPVRCALKQYKVYTPVETKKVNGKTGLASLSSYYALYSVQDYYMDNDELVGTFFAPNHNGFGSTYYLLQTWYTWKRHGVLLAANQYITADSKKDIWTGYKDFVDSRAWDELDKTIELRIIDYDFVGQPGKTFSMVGNELKPILLDNDVAHTDYCEIKGSSGGNNGRPNMILYKGTRNGETAYNFYCLPTADTTAKMANKTAYIQRQGCTYKQYYDQNKTVKENGEKIMLVSGTYDDEAVGIDIVENNADMQRIEDGVFYNLAGQKVSTPTKGIYIYNGRKVLVK